MAKALLITNKRLLLLLSSTLMLKRRRARSGETLTKRRVGVGPYQWMLLGRRREEDSEYYSNTKPI